VSFGELLQIARKAVLETFHTLFFPGCWLFVAPTTSTETLSSNAGTREDLAASGFWDGWRPIARKAQSLAYSWVIANASRLNWSQIIAKANYYGVNRSQRHDELSVQSNVQCEIVHSSCHESLSVAVGRRES